ncbi:MAG: hypothetical protein GF416_02590 [Candidatus Altiarchaeales archaeon]|nr:hypothetical protein [Candidatus Altiarchaeales archaeon]MBD3416007.1 hypothetical protein [Candidatus Altiarchaeales archaeon]
MMKGKKTKTEPEVIHSPNSKVCVSPGCPLCTPLGLALFLVGFMVVFYTDWPYQVFGWLTLALAYLQAWVKPRW